MAEVTIHDDDGEPIKVIVNGVDRVTWSAILDAHPPREGTDDVRWNSVTFPPALIAACTGTPLVEARQMWEDLPQEDGDALFDECLRRSSPVLVDWAVRRLQQNPRTRAEVRAAMQLGISRTEFLTWPEDDQDYVIAAMLMEANVCPGGCGTPLDKIKDPTAYKTRSYECRQCMILDSAREMVPKDARSYVHVVLEPIGE